jgi:hypothetical protein
MAFPSIPRFLIPPIPKFGDAVHHIAFQNRHRMKNPVTADNHGWMQALPSASEEHRIEKDDVTKRRNNFYVPSSRCQCLSGDKNAFGLGESVWLQLSARLGTAAAAPCSP